MRRAAPVGRVDKFFLPPPFYPNMFQTDSYFQAVLQRYAPRLVEDKDFMASLNRLGERCSSKGDITKLGNQAEAQPPKLVQYGPFGHRVDRIEVSAAWDRLKDISAEEAIVASGYQRERYGDLARLVQFSRMYLFYPASALFSCPLAMTDGAARVLELYGKQMDIGRHFSNLTSTTPSSFWTSGQHMTERTGGSDVGNSETLAYEQDDGTFRLHGYKFFTSATTSEMAIALARVVDRSGNSVAGSRGLSCFFVRLNRDPETQQLEGIIVHRLKDKLGTKAVPTAELEFTGCPATLIGERGRGVPVISSLFNITRWQNAVWCVSAMRRSITLARSHANVRSVSGALLREKPLHLETLADMELETRAATLLVARVSLLLGKEESGTSTEQENVVLRMLTPLAKLYTAKQAMYVISEAIECLGGVGYCEDSGLPQLLRDAQVTPVWEGTTNILSLDVWRPITKENGLKHFLEDVSSRAKVGSPSPQVAPVVNAITSGIQAAISFAKTAAKDNEKLETSARYFSYALSKLYMASLLLEHANITKSPEDIECALRWIQKHSLTPDAREFDASHRSLSKAIALGSKL